MTSLGQFCTAGTIKCNKIIATEAEIPGGGGGSDIDVSSINFDNKWKIYLDTNSNFIIKNEAQNVISLSGDAHTGKVTLRDFNLEDLANVDTIGLLSGDVMYYDGTNQKYKFTNTLNYAGSSWDLSNIPLNFTGSDLRIQSTNNSNIFIGGTNRTDSTTNGGSIGIGVEAGDTSNNVFNVAIGYHAGKIKQGHGSLLAGQCIAIGFNSGENNQDALAIAVGGNSGKTDQSEGAIAVGNNAGNTKQGIHSIAIGVGAGFSQQDDNSVAIGLNAGSLNQDGNCIAIGSLAAETNQDPDAIAIGNTAGQASQGQNSVAIGTLAGQIGQGQESIAIGDQAGKTSQGSQSIAMGHQSGETGQANEAIAIGHQAGKSTQLSNSVCLGHQAGFSGLGTNSIGIGRKASFTGGSHDNTIVLNATGLALNPQGTDRTYIKPIREELNNEFLHYDSITGEVTKSIAVNFTSNFLLNNQSGVSGEVLTSQGALSSPVWTTPSSGGSSLAVSSFISVGLAPPTGNYPINGAAQILTFASYTEAITSPNVSENTGLGTFTINIAGTYIINVMVTISALTGTNPASRIDARLRNNQTIIGFSKIQFVSRDLQEAVISINVIATLAQNDIIDLQGSVTEVTSTSTARWNSSSSKIYFLKIA